MSNPISPEQLKLLRDQLRNIPNLKRQVENAIKAKIDPGTTLQEIAEMEEKIKAILEVYDKPS